MGPEAQVNEAVMRALGIEVKNAVEVQITLKVGKPPEVVVTSLLTGIQQQKIEGTLKVKGTPDYAVRREVCLIRERDMVCVAAQWSDPITGAYSFVGYDPRERYTVVAYDYTNAFRAVVADNVIPEAM